MFNRSCDVARSNPGPLPLISVPAFPIDIYHAYCLKSYRKLFAITSTLLGKFPVDFISPVVMKSHIIITFEMICKKYLMVKDQIRSLYKPHDDTLKVLCLVESLSTYESLSGSGWMIPMQSLLCTSIHSFYDVNVPYIAEVIQFGINIFYGSQNLLWFAFFNKSINIELIYCEFIPNSLFQSVT